MTTEKTDCRIYAACLASYNNGVLFGRWIDCEGKSGDELRGEIADMLKASPAPDAEEWAIHDHEGFGRLIGTEWPDLDDVAALAEILAADDDQTKALHWLIEDRGAKVADAIKQCDEVRIYEADAHDLAGITHKSCLKIRASAMIATS